MAHAKTPAIVFDDVTFQYDSQAEPTLRHINLTIYSGEKVLIVGPSGSGKSTLGNLMNGLIPHVLKGELIGTVTVGGKDVAKNSHFELSETIGTVLQDPDSQFVGLTTGEDIAFALENDDVAVDTMHKQVHKWAERLQIVPQLEQSPQSLSGGQKQRTTLAGVLIDEGPILLFDEPLAALDPATGQSTIDLIDELHREIGVTVVIIEHRLEEVLTKPVDRVILVADGTIQADMAPSDLLRSDLLQQYGLREPLYVEALNLAGVALEEVSDLEAIAAVDAPALQEHLATWLGEQAAIVPPSLAEDLLTVNDLDFSYRPERPIFQGLNLTIRRGDMLALVGPNGVGKTTLSQLLTGFVQPTDGDIRLEGSSLLTQSIKERADHIGYIMQDPNQMISQLQIFDEVALGLRLRGLTEEEIEPRVLDALQICGLYEFRNWPIAALSFGQKKRVTIASIIVLNTEILILDEPTAGQDWRHYTEMMRFLERLNQDRGLTMVLITHDMHLMLEYANRTVVLSAQGILADADPAAVLTNEALVEAASLAEPSLFTLANRFGLPPTDFTRQVVRVEREVRA